ncbi:MAG: ribonuclease E/G, partial [Kordiimonas sp.]
MSHNFTIIEAAIGQWRSAEIDEDGLPLNLNFHDDVSISPLDAIFDGRVTRVDPTLDMAFLDLGNGLTGALNFRRARLLVKGQVSSISDCVREGDLLRVQVVSEPSALEDKALPVTPRPRLTGRYIVAETGKPRLNLSKDLTHRQTSALKAALTDVVTDVAIIVRSRAGAASVEAVVQEVKALQNALTAGSSTHRLVHAWKPAEKALLATADNGDLFVEGGGTLSILKATAKQFWPDLLDRLELYKSGGLPAFEELGVEEAIEEALAERINLPSGGWIAITP